MCLVSEVHRRLIFVGHAEGVGNLIDQPEPGADICDVLEVFTSLANIARGDLKSSSLLCPCRIGICQGSM